MCRWRIFCGNIFRASFTVGWLVDSADVCWQFRWSQACLGGASLENRHHCLCDGQNKGPKWLQATGCVWVFVCSANLCVCVCVVLLLNMKSVNCNCGTDVSSKHFTVLVVLQYDNINAYETRLKWLTGCVKTWTDVEAHVTHCTWADVVPCMASPLTSGRTDWPKYIIKVTTKWYDRCRVVPLL